MNLYRPSIVFAILISLIACKPEKKDPLEDLFLLLVLQNLLAPAPASGPCSTTGIPNDPLFSSQWHLSNNGSTTGAVSGEDANITFASNAGCKGTGVSIVTVDDGMDITHEDLAPNYDSSLDLSFGGSFFNTIDCSTNGTRGCHGTSVSGIMAARDSNDIGLSGIAPRAKIGARNVLVNATDTNAGSAMTTNTRLVSVSNNSWGAADNTGRLAASGSSWRSSISSAFNNGRNLLGTIFFWAAGNGGTLITSANIGGMTGSAPRDNSNHDGQANFHSAFAVAAIGNDGKKASYSEEGANLLVSAHSQGTSGVAISTTDITGSGGYNTNGGGTNFSNSNYTNTFNGTSAAAPLAAGIGALILERNPNLKARDVRVLLARHSRKNDPSDPDWVTNGAGLNFNHKYGFGAVDASLAIPAAQSWTNIGTEIVTGSLAGSTGNPTITNNNTTGAVNTRVVSGSGIGKIEFVEITITVATGGSDDSGDLYIELTSPSGTKARLMVPHICTSNNALAFCTDLSNWRLGATIFMDEPADGTWTLKVADVCNKPGSRTCTSSSLYSYTRNDADFTHASGLTNNNTNHSLTSWSMQIRGRAN
ncbi:S8 family serine peptidase [Leptospira sp. GIMC2001]|uniref:S8 family serine peptidase n=1 Tax=Leptospira sp. GIMC2001 TaxID=1513297 RepID=UPI00234AE11C|nr:S8 family serine peptidase [Leptospira sp. GIMC2001]WCL48757.1 S8 family serine peptidase [Leptospira sp. GIMC2001]